MSPRRGDSLLLYGLFFPTVTSGPILRPGIFFPQLREKGFLHPDWSDAAAGIYAICCGTIKKVLLADAFGTVVNNGWVHLEELSAPAAWLVILGYTLQLYFDFSGYCDIAAGVARLFGLRLPMNFDSPYRGASVTEFWKRWHITLTTFLRECLYFPWAAAAGARSGRIAIFSSSSWSAASGTGPGGPSWCGAPSTAWPRWWNGFGAGAGTGCLCPPVGADLSLCQHRLGVLPGTGLYRGPGAAGPGRHRRLCKTGGLALGGLFAEETSAVQMLIPAFTPWKNILRVVPAVWGRDGRRPLAPEHHPSDGGLPAYALAGRGPHSADALVCAVLYRRHHLHLFQLLRRAV